ncbi:SusC/RagA family TonB-linked outer membrane protein [Bacteroides uniformis]|uniref:SusC/RagA family TonB-linked outer membrane protein n=1 Tax=Bacteroides uniformis TaxID=820 RepID=UPI001C00DE18|nr:TonB-dependent receptor [Bacteroides uniformis]MBT9922363.1 SusC/RagA family TonB-linked outer membrane protein [Bacteroides uniformis]
MNENHKKRGLTHSRLLTAVAISSLLLSSGNVMATQANPDNSFSITEQLQTINVTGLVVDAAGEPVIGASVVEKGTTNGNITNVDGKFTLTVKTGAILQISYVGYQTQEIKATKMMKIVLKEDSELLSEVVVVGYGAQKRENLTGSVASVDVNKTLEGRQIPDVGRGLQGTTPGLSVVIPSGEIGSDPTMKIRGQIGSIDGASTPLILLDNVEIPSIQMVNPDDIESISVLKDAASASIYGAKGAFGVVLITSKKGAKSEKVDVSYSGNFSWQNISKKMEMAGVDGIQYRIDALRRSGGTIAGAFWYVNETSLERAREWEKTWGGKIGKNDPFVFGRDWYVDASNRKFSMRTFDPYDYMIREWTPSQTHNISVSGKSGKTTYNASLGYLDQNGLMKLAKHDDFRRWNSAVRISTEINKYITFRAGANYSKRNKRYAYATNSTTADPWLYLYRWDSTYPMGYDEHGNELRSPASEIHQANTANIENNYLSFNTGATINLTKDWKIEIDYTYAGEDQIWKKNGTKFTAADTWSAPVKRLDENGQQIYVNNQGNVVPAGSEGAIAAYDLLYHQYTTDGANPDHIRREVKNAKRHTLNITTDYNWQINDDNNLKVLIGMNRTDWESEDNWSQITNLTDIISPSWDKTIGTQTSSGNLYWDGQLGFFGRINYNLMDKYLLEANVRYDGSSKFPSNLQWRTFPSFSAGWRIGEEAFMQWAKPALSSLKLRGSWGMIGDQTVPNTLYVPTISQGNTNTYAWLDADGNKLIMTGTPAAIDANITWQDIYTLDFGVDARFFNGELGVTFDWFQRDTKNMIVPGAGVAPTFGAGAPKGNFGSLRTKGWELSIDYNHRFNNGLSVNAMFTLSDALTEITEYGDTKSIDSWYVGKQYGEIWGYRTDRLYQKDDFVYEGDKLVTTWALNGKEVAAGTPGAKEVNKLKDPNGIYQDYFQSGTFRFGPGDVKFQDLNGDGQINDGSRSIDDHGDVEKIGNTTPRFEYGLRLGASYKGFDASIFMQGVGNRKLWGAGFLAIPGFNTGDGAMPQAIAGDYWTEENTNAFYPAACNMGGSNSGYNLQKQDRYLLDMAYFRIKNITIGYTLPSELTKKILINKARIYLACENFFTFDKLNGLPIDPEEISGYSMFNSDNYNSGRTGVGTPTMKNMSVGIQLNF